ncbi:hypothetical protein [Bacillus phage vB_BanS-Thrax1]|nr:hypothetical protein [Bacillus phage vB_BanS-Thrax1]
MFYSIRRAIRNLRDWLPVILKDEHWDYGFTYEILYRKLELKEQFFRSKYTSVADWKETANEIKEVKDALKRLIDDEYYVGEEERPEELKQRDKDIVFDGMKNNIEKWWD